MKRPILIITIGFIIGILGGLYFNIVPFVFLFCILLTLILKSIKLRSNNKYIQILNIFIKNNIILIFLISAFISSIYLIYCNRKYEKIYNEFSCKEITAIVVSNRKETEYKYTYKIKLEEYEGIHFILRVSKSKNIELNYGDKIQVTGEYLVAEVARNYGGFNYKEYLKIQKVYGIFDADKVEIINNNNLNYINLFSNNIKQKIIDGANKVLPEKTRDLFLGILIGYDDNLSDDIQESFRKSNLTHLLAVSGAHIAYIIVGMSFALSRLKITKRATNFLTIIFLIFFMYITDFSSSVVRAAIMGMMLLVSLILFRKNDILTTISFSLLLILLKNPYKILDIGLLLSYFATIGIIYFSKTRNKYLKEDKSILNKMIKYLKELIAITVFANIFVMPIMIYNFNTISLTFIISNLIAGILIGPITIGGFIISIILIINIKLAYIFAIIYNLLLELLLQSTRIISLIPMSEILIPTPSIIIIILYYLFLFVFTLYNFLKQKYSNRYLVKKILSYAEESLKRFRNNYKVIFVLIFTIFILIILVSEIIPNNLKIYFIDVGQGDSTLIVTPSNKRILIDSGGAETGSFDGGKSILVPYLLDRKIISLDYICISHFDADHCKNFIYLLNNIKVKNIILSKQYESTPIFEEVINIANEKKINILRVEAGDIIQIDTAVVFKILNPGKQLINDINRNSIVMKLEYNNFSCLFTGDISKDIEKNLVKEYGDYLKSDILKVAHHGSKTSSSEEFIEVVNPKISLIGVGKNNKFGHPNESVLKILKNINSKIYRTDLDGEIKIVIDKRGRIRIKKILS